MAHHYDTYREELAKAHPGFGYALWNPSPGEQDPPQPGVGDVGFIRGGRFHRLFNALLPESQKCFGTPEYHEPLQPKGQDHIYCEDLNPNTLYSFGVNSTSGGFGVSTTTYSNCT